MHYNEENEQDSPEYAIGEPPPLSLHELGLKRLGEVGLQHVAFPNLTANEDVRYIPSVQDAQPLAKRTSRAYAQELEDGRVLLAKSSFALRRVPKHDMRTLISGAVRPRSGDVVLAVVDRLRQHPRIELPSGRRAKLQVGDEIILACGNRYATDQFEAVVPTRLGRAHLVAAGGLAGIAINRAISMKPATEITLLGLVGDASGVPLNLRSYSLDVPREVPRRPPVLMVFGTAMNSGKTTTAQALIHGLTQAGYRVGYAKITGTGAGGDYWSMIDVGAFAAVDFTDAGLPSTYLLPIPVIEEVALTLIGHLTSVGCERIVVEVADGLLQRETAMLINSPVIHSLVDSVLFAAGDAIAATAGVKILNGATFKVMGVSGLVSASPLPSREATESAGVPVWTREELKNPTIASALVDLPALRDAHADLKDQSTTQAARDVLEAIEDSNEL